MCRYLWMIQNARKRSCTSRLFINQFKSKTSTGHTCQFFKCLFQLQTDLMRWVSSVCGHFFLLFCSKRNYSLLITMWVVQFTIYLSPIFFYMKHKILKRAAGTQKRLHFTVFALFWQQFVILCQRYIKYKKDWFTWWH